MVHNEVPFFHALFQFHWFWVISDPNFWYFWPVLECFSTDSYETSTFFSRQTKISTENLLSTMFYHRLWLNRVPSFYSSNKPQDYRPCDCSRLHLNSVAPNCIAQTQLPRNWQFITITLTFELWIRLREQLDFLDNSCEIIWSESCEVSYECGETMGEVPRRENGTGHGGSRLP